MQDAVCVQCACIAHAGACRLSTPTKMLLTTDYLPCCLLLTADRPVELDTHEDARSRAEAGDSELAKEIVPACMCAGDGMPT